MRRLKISNTQYKQRTHVEEPRYVLVLMGSANLEKLDIRALKKLLKQYIIRMGEGTIF